MSERDQNLRIRIEDVFAADEDTYVSLSWYDGHDGFRLYIADVDDEWERCSARFTRDQLIDAAICMLKAANVREFMVDRAPGAPR